MYDKPVKLRQLQSLEAKLMLLINKRDAAIENINSQLKTIHSRLDKLSKGKSRKK